MSGVEVTEQAGRLTIARGAVEEAPTMTIHVSEELFRHFRLVMIENKSKLMDTLPAYQEIENGLFPVRVIAPGAGPGPLPEA